MKSHCDFVFHFPNDIEVYFMFVLLICISSLSKLDVIFFSSFCLCEYKKVHLFFIIFTVVMVKKVLFFFFSGFCKTFGYSLQNSRKDLARLCNNNKINSSSLLFEYVFHIEKDDGTNSLLASES